MAGYLLWRKYYNVAMYYNGRVMILPESEILEMPVRKELGNCFVSRTGTFILFNIMV